ncbi:MAG: hypothetical protein ACRCZO_07035, partial [Cetobacterium sp.]
REMEQQQVQRGEGKMKEEAVWEADGYPGGGEVQESRKVQEVVTQCSCVVVESGVQERAQIVGGLMCKI